jgi:hypothetical protein
MTNTKTKVIEVAIERSEGSDLLVAVSDDLRGLFVGGYSIADIAARLPGAIRCLLECAGASVAGVRVACMPRDNMRLRFEARFAA